MFILCCACTLENLWGRKKEVNSQEGAFDFIDEVFEIGDYSHQL
jgi:hypothetical protein